MEADEQENGADTLKVRVFENALVVTVSIFG